MPYATKYQIDFLNNDEKNFSIFLLLKDYSGSISQLTAGPNPFVLSYTSGDDSIINPIRASEAEINFYNEGATPLTEFYSEDDEAWRIDYYYNDPGGAKLIWMGFVVQDACQETFQDPPHLVTLKATDNLALLKDVPFNEAFIPEITEHFNDLIWAQGATGISDGRITLGLTFQSSTTAPAGFITGNSPYQDLSGFNIATDDSRWIIKNTGTDILDFHITGTITIQWNDFGEDYMWLLQTNAGTQTILVRRTETVMGVPHNYTFDETFSLPPGQRLYAFGYSFGDFNNSKTYFASTWNFAIQTGSTSTNIIDKLSLFDYIRFSLLKTGLRLQFASYLNIYENTMGDRGDDPGNDMLRQTRLFSGMFLSDDGVWDDCYSILERILKPLNATLTQAQGRWNVVRFYELNGKFGIASGHLIGSLYDENFEIITGLDYDAGVFFQMALSHLINADHTTRILRPFKEVKFTFDYQQPNSLINGIDLKTTGDLDHTTTVGTIRYDYYQIPPFWKHIDGDTSLIVVVTDIPTATELERYIYMPKFGDQYRFLQFNPIEVTKGDEFDFTLSFRHYTATSEDDIFSIRFLLVLPNDTYYVLRGSIGDGSKQPVAWAGPFPLVDYNSATELTTFVFVDGNTDDSEWSTFSLLSIQQNAQPQWNLPNVPEDGVLLINIAGGNNPDSDLADVEMLITGMSLEFVYRINKSTLITGHNHLQEITPQPKNKLDDEIEIDDSPRNTIAGTLFTVTQTNFGADIGDVYFTKTKNWHRFNITESKRLGEIITFELEDMQARPRTILEGSFKYNDPTISLLNVFQIDNIPGPNFIFGVTTFNFMEGIFSATLWELFSTGEVAASAEYTFKYIYETR